MVTIRCTRGGVGAIGIGAVGARTVFSTSRAGFNGFDGYGVGFQHGDAACFGVALTGDKWISHGVGSVTMSVVRFATSTEGLDVGIY